jgi:phosphopantothenoylcysteine decarboxylase/phosphopantothenate--cysteine ligase
VTSGIACYKAVDLMRDLQRAGARVRVIESASAAELVRPALFEALSGEQVGTSLWEGWSHDEEGAYAQFPHLDFARGIDALVVAPATASLLGKAAAGIGDDLLTTTLLAVDPRNTPVVLVPTMNATMYAHPAVVANRAVLRERGYWIVTPDEGPLACGEEGIGRWPGNRSIVAALDRVVNGSTRLEGHRVVVTAGRTEEDIDPARTLTNRASGRMGFALARAAWLHGADVTLIHGPTELPTPPFVRTVAVRTVAEMGEAVRMALPGASQLWMAAAVNDWAPDTAEHKLKKDEWDGVLHLSPVETDDMLERARAKLESKGCDYIVVNNPLEEGAGFGHATNRVVLLSRDGAITDFELMSKHELAERLVNHILDQQSELTTAER